VRGKPTSGKRSDSVRRLRARLAEAEATLEAIRNGEVDAVVVTGPDGDRALAIEGALHPYHLLLNAMSDGAALLTRDGTILFCNHRLGEIAHAPLERLRGSRLEDLVAPAERSGLQELLRKGATRNDQREFAVVAPEPPATPVRIALSAVPLGGYPGQTGVESTGGALLMAIVTDLTTKKHAEATRLGLMKRLISAEDEERRRIARELHDETGQSLTTLLVGLRAIEERAVAPDMQSAAHRLRSVAAQTLDNVGRLARGLHPSVLDDMGLAAAVRRYVDDYKRSFDLTVDLRMEAGLSDPLPPLVQTTMYRILQEALTNVARHARARVVVVELERVETMLELVVEDDGVGFDPGALVRDASGLGLHGMRERAELLGGSIEFESTPGEGTSVRARIPAAIAPARKKRSR